MLDFYLKEGKAIFANKLGMKSLRQYLTCKFSAAPLETALKRHFGDKCFGHSTKRLVIPAYNLGENDVYIFRTAHTSDLKRDYKVPAWKVALSTSAAPSYFPSARVVGKLRLIDGGGVGQQSIDGSYCRSLWSPQYSAFPAAYVEHRYF